MDTINKLSQLTNIPTLLIKEQKSIGKNTSRYGAEYNVEFNDWADQDDE